MCSTPSIPSTTTTNTENVAAPTYADASVTKAGAATKQKTASLAGRDIKTSARGLSDSATTTTQNVRGLSDTTNEKKSLLGN